LQVWKSGVASNTAVIAIYSAVMPAHSRPKDGVASLAYVAGIHALATK
jgi:hypothetical protein